MLALRRDSWIFQDKDARDIACELLADYPQVRFDFDVTQPLDKRPICTQYRESDLEFFTRLLASEGLSWRFEHAPFDDARADHGQARHRLVIFDARAMAPSTPGGDILRFHGVRAADRDDAIDTFRARRRVAANAIAISSWDPGQSLAPAAEQQSSLDAGDLPVLPLYDGSGERIASAGSARDRHSRLMLQALELDNKLFEGAGAVRRLAAGHRFSLTQHERYPAGENGFTVLWVRHEARNNLDSGIARVAPSGVEDGTYRNTFGCARDTVALLPSALAAPQPCTAPGPQTALVVGLPGAVATTTRDHQVRIQFPWQRGAQPNPGGIAHGMDKRANGDGCAPGDDRSGTWVRVAEALAGPNWGTQFTPRIGTEVLVDFIEGDIDRPVVVAQLYTGADLPPFSAGVDSGADHAGVLSGIHTRNFDGSGYNQWQLDDTPGQLRMRLATSSAATQLNLGYLVQQEPESARRGAYRGSGVTSTQMDAAEALAGFKGAQALGDALGKAAIAQQALFSKDAAQAQAEFIDQIDPQAKGRYDGTVNGQQALRPKNGTRELDPRQPVEKLGSALVLMDSAASINWATPASTVLYEGQQLHWTTQSDLHLTAARTLSAVAGNAAGFFTHAGGIQVIAANGPVSLRAHTDRLEVLADRDVTVVSVNDGIEIKAKDKIVLQAGQSAVTLEGGDITFACPGTFSVKGGQHVFDGGGSKTADLPSLPGGLGKEAAHWTGLHYVDAESAQGIANADYEIHFDKGPVLAGTLDRDGKALRENVLNKRVKKVLYHPRKPNKEEPHDPLNKLIG